MPQAERNGAERASYTRALRERIVQLAFGSAMAVLVVVGSVAYRGVLASNDSSALVRHTLEVLENLEDTQLAMETIVESSRGFVLTGDEPYLERYQATTLSLARHEAAVGRLTTDNAEQQRTLSALQTLTAERMQRADLNINLRRIKGFAAAADAIYGQPAARAATDFLAIVSKMQNEERRLLAIRDADATRYSSQTNAILFLGIVLGLLITGTAFWCVRRDNSRRWLAESALRDSEEKYRLLVSGVKDYAIFMLDSKGNVASWNEGAERIKGYKAAEIMGKNFSVFYTPEDLAREKPAEELIQAAAEGKFEEEGWRLRKDGSPFWASVLITTVRGENGELRGFSKVTRDVTERKNIEERLKENEIRHRLLADNSIDMILLMRRDGTRLYASPACRALLGYEPMEMLALSTKDAIHPEDFPMVFERLANGENDLETLTYRMRRKDGSYVWVESVVKAIAEEAGQPLQRLLVVRDIEQRVAVEQRVKESEARYRLLADHSTDMVFRLDANLVRRYVSPACREILGYEPEELIGREVVGMLHPDDADRVTRIMRSILDGSVDRQSVINRTRRRDQQWIWVEAQFRVLKDPKTDERIGIIGALRDISVRKAVEDKLAEATRRLEALAREDGLTGLPNRRSFDDALSREYRRARRNKKRLGLIILDVDWFKSFNDHYGHPAGDDCLRQVSKAIKNAIFRPGDMAARYGGEEFVMLLPDTDEAGAALIGERIRQAVSLLAVQHEASRYGVVTVSVGIASFGRDTHLPRSEMLLEYADRALYRAKADGRNLVVRASALFTSPTQKPSTAA